MNALIFVGPTLPLAEAQPILAARYLPPAAQGDVYRAALTRPQLIGIIDGYFEHMPSIWHKEILWAMAQGIHVVGAASMGALRAAELAAFGMEGVGQIAAAYTAGTLEDDDEVAVAHGPPETGYRLLSEALVNIRATLAAAEAAQIIGPACHAALLQIAKQQFFADRAYPRILQAAAAQGLPPDELAALRSWLPAGRVDQKRADALELLRLVGQRLAAGLAPKRVHYHFEHTIFWERLRQSTISATDDADALADRRQRAALLEELRLDLDAYRQVRQTAISRALAEALGCQQGYELPEAELVAATASFRSAHGLESAAATHTWLHQCDIDEAAFADLMRQEALLGWATSRAIADLEGSMVDELRASGAYQQLRDRARHKRQLLTSLGLETPSLTDLGLTRADLLGWYAARQASPPPHDLAGDAQQRGFRDEHALIQALLREYCYARHQPDSHPISKEVAP